MAPAAELCDPENPFAVAQEDQPMTPAHRTETVLSEDGKLSLEAVYRVTRYELKGLTETFEVSDDRIKRFLESHPGTVVIATCRRAANGGKFRGSIASQVDVLSKAVAAGCQLVDVELQTATKVKPAQLQKLRSRAALILSSHDFRATKKLDETLEKMLAFPAGQVTT